MQSQYYHPNSQPYKQEKNIAKMTTLNTLSLVILVLTISCMTNSHVSAQNCGCDAGYCCSQWGSCGTTADYCGDGCQEGPCYSSNPSPSGGSVSDLVTDAFFNGIIDQADSSCAGKGFYTRSAFLDAFNSYPQFGTGGSSDDTKREVAAFFAHVTHETGHFCYTEEIAKAVYCRSSAEWPCNPNVEYYGRGPIQITWNYNYGPAGQSIGFDGLNAPETVANDPVISFKTAFWFWMNNVHSIVVSGQGFGETIKAINGGECNGGNTPAVNARVSYYTDYCNELGVSPGDNLTC